jgi:uncharacterized coiled-coil protein SlyX
MGGAEGGMEGRLVELETRSAFQEAEILDLGKLILDQEARISRLEMTLKALRDKVKDMSGEGLGPLPEGERPPHY